MISNDTKEFYLGIIGADQALITALKNQKHALRDAIETLINCADNYRDFEEIRKARKVLSDTFI